MSEGSSFSKGCGATLGVLAALPIVAFVVVGGCLGGCALFFGAVRQASDEAEAIRAQQRGETQEQAGTALDASTSSAAETEKPKEASTPIAVGDQVVTTQAAKVKRGKTVLTTVPEGTMLKALAIRGEWVKVEVESDGDSVTGWILMKKLRRQ